MSSVIVSGDTSGAVTLSAPAVAGTTTLTLPATSGTILQSGTAVTEAQGGTGTTTGYYGFKNRIINGQMVLDQRNAGASLTINTTVPYTLDRWVAFATVTSKYSVQQNAAAVTPPAGFKSYLGVTSLAATSLSASDYYFVCQKIEGYNCADLGFGAAGASTVTVSFWVRSSLTGTFGGALNNGDSSRAYPFTYTINAANTWEQKTVTIAGDTSGTWDTTNGKSVIVIFGLGVGSTGSGTAGSWSSNAYFSATGATSVVGTNGATFYITGVQLEKGSTATSFDYRPFGTELALCQRYFQPVGNGASGRTANATTIELIGNFVNSFRAAPTLTFGGFSGANTTIGQFSVGNVTGTALSSYLSNANSGFYAAITVSGATSGSSAGVVSGDVCSASAEL